LNCRTVELSNRRTALFPDRAADQGPAEAVAEVHPLPYYAPESLPGGSFFGEDRRIEASGLQDPKDLLRAGWGRQGRQFPGNMASVSRENRILA
jgi:hypothetical protein